MRQFKVAAAALGLVIGVLAAAPASAWNRGNVQVLTVLPDLINQPGVKSSVEGITVGLPPDNNIYAASSGVNAETPPTDPANLFVIAPDGTLVRQISIGNASPFVNGLRFNPATGALWVLDAGNGQVLNVDPTTGASSFLADSTLFPAGTTLNALTFDAAGNGYVTDSINGAIYKIPSGGGSVVTWSSDPLLKPAPPLKPDGDITPPFGANGIEFNPPGCNPTPPCRLFVANTANRQILEILPDMNGNAGPARVFINGINGPDGIAIRDDRIFVCAGQEDEIVVIEAIGPTPGTVIAKLGDFDGIDGTGRVLGFLFPASLAFSNDKNTLYVSNLASPNQRAIDSAWASEVVDYTVSKLSAMLPPIP